MERYLVAQQENPTERVFMFIYTQSIIYLTVVGLSCGCMSWGKLGVKPLHGQHDAQMNNRKCPRKILGSCQGPKSKGKPSKK